MSLSFGLRVCFRYVTLLCFVQVNAECISRVLPCSFSSTDLTMKMFEMFTKEHDIVHILVMFLFHCTHSISLQTVHVCIAGTLRLFRNCHLDLLLRWRFTISICRQHHF